MKESTSAAMVTTKIDFGAVLTVRMYVTPKMNGPKTSELPVPKASQSLPYRLMQHNL